METKEKSKRLVIEVPNDLHIEIKMRAVQRGITLKKYIIRSVMETIKKEKSYE